VKHVPLSLFNASADSVSGNIERVLIQLNLNEKGVYLPPKLLKDVEASLVFVPALPTSVLPTPEDNNEKLLCEVKNGVFLTPPGLELCKLFEQALGVSFTKVDLPYLQSALPKLMIDELEVAEALELRSISNIITVDVTGTLFLDQCQKTAIHIRTRTTNRCLLSAHSFSLAKAVGEPLVVLREMKNFDTKSLRIQYLIKSSVVVSDEEGTPIIFGKEPITTRRPPAESIVHLPEIPVVHIGEEHLKKEAAVPEVPVIIIREVPRGKSPCGLSAEG
jgi:hypothetical protein